MISSKPAAQFAVVVAAHLVLFAALLTFTPVREAMVQIIPVVASIVPVRRAEPPPQPRPPQKIAPKDPAPPVPAPAAPAPVISAEPQPAQPPAMTTTVPAPQPPAPTVAPPAPPVAAAPKPAAPSPFTPPRSDAAYLNNPKPQYPPASLRLGEAGRVVLAVQVSATGSVEQASVRTSSGSERLDQAALRAVRQWKFIPAMRGGEAVAAQVLVPISFNPDSE